VPADGGSGSIFGDERVLEFRGGEPREIGSVLTQPQQEVGDFLCAVIGVVAQPERDDPPLAEIAVEFVFLEIQLSKMLQKCGFFVRRHKVRSIFEPFRQGSEWFQKAELTAGHANRDIITFAYA